MNYNGVVIGKEKKTTGREKNNGEKERGEVEDAGWLRTSSCI